MAGHPVAAIDGLTDALLHLEDAAEAGEILPIPTTKGKQWLKTRFPPPSPRAELWRS